MLYNIIMKNKRRDVGYIIRVCACVLVFLIAVIYFSYSCKTLANNYFLVAAAPWLIKFAVASILFMVVLAVTVVLLRPFWIAIITYGLGAVLYAFMVGFSMAVLIAAAVFWVALILYLFFEIGQLNNQIKFSTHPLGDKKILICSLLAVMVSVAFGVGYSQDSIKRNYVVPPETKAFVMKQAADVADKMLSEQKITAQQKQIAVKQTEEKLQAMMSDTEKNLKPAQKYIPIVLGVAAFLCFQMVLFLISFISAIFIPLAFWLLKISRFAHTAVEKCETQHLTLRTIA